MREIDVVRERVNLLERKCALLERENALLKKTIRESLSFIQIRVPPSINLETPLERAERWMDKSVRFAGLRSLILKVATDLMKKEGKALHQDRILDAIRKSSKTRKVWNRMKTPESTCGRRLRELRKDEWLTSPKMGYFWLGPKLFEPPMETEVST